MVSLTKSTLAKTINCRSTEISGAIFEELTVRVMAYMPTHKSKFKNPLYSIDIATADLCLSHCGRAYCRKYKMAVKPHAVLDISGNLPCFLLMSNGKISDTRAAKENIPILQGGIRTLDKG